MEPILGPAISGYEDENWARQLDWILQMMHGRASVATDAEIAEHFDSEHLERVPADATRARLDKMRALLVPFVIHSVAHPAPTRGVAFLSAPPGPSRVIVDLDPETGQIVGWVSGPYLDVELDDLARWLPVVAPRSQFLVAELDNATCRPLIALNPDEPLAISSISKLYVLLALTRYIAEGNASWETPLMINDEWKAPGSGEWQYELAGTSHTLRQFAEIMVTRSDNTASDHILHTIGRERVEQAVIDSGGSEPFLNIPFLSKGESSALQRLPKALRQRYTALPSDEKRRFLEHDLMAAENDVPEHFAGDSTQFEPLASATDLCNLAVTLWNRPDAAPVIEILALYPNFPGSGLRKADWPYRAGKSGWFWGNGSLMVLLQRQDGRVFFVSVTINRTVEQVLKKNLVLALVWRLADTLGDE